MMATVVDMDIDLLFNWSTISQWRGNPILNLSGKQDETQKNLQTNTQDRLKNKWTKNSKRVKTSRNGFVLTCVTIGTGTFLLTINMLWHALHVLASHVNLSHRRWTRQDGIQSWGSTMAQTICNGIKRTQILVPENSGQLLQNKRYEKFLHDFLNYWWRHVGQTTLSLIRNGDSQSKQWARIVSAVRILWGNSPAACRSELLGDLDVVPQITIHCVSYWWFQTFFMFPHIWDNPSHWRTYMFQDG